MAAKIPDSPFPKFNFGELIPSFSWSYDSTIFPWKGTNTWLKAVDVTLIGHSFALTEPAKTMDWWWWNNQETIKEACEAVTYPRLNIYVDPNAYRVSSWAMVVDIYLHETAPAFKSAV
jgi:hypothetical protein